MKKRTKALSIRPSVRADVLERDRYCILCGRRGIPNAHFISRAQSGLGIKENIVTLCPECHHRYDHTADRPKLKQVIKEYLDDFYPNFSDKDRVYKKYEDYD